MATTYWIIYILGKVLRVLDLHVLTHSPHYLKLVNLVSQFYKWLYWGTVLLSNLIRVNTISGKAEIWIQVVWPR